MEAADAGNTGGFNKVEVKRINYDTLETSLPEAQMQGKQVMSPATPDVRTFA